MGWFYYVYGVRRCRPIIYNLFRVTNAAKKDRVNMSDTHAHTHPVTHRHRLHCNTVSTMYSYQCPERCVNKKTVHKFSTPIVHTTLRILCRPRHVRTSAVLSLLARPKMLYTALSIQASSRQALVVYQTKSQPQIHTVRKVDNMTSLAQL